MQRFLYYRVKFRVSPWRFPFRIDYLQAYLFVGQADRVMAGTGHASLLAISDHRLEAIYWGIDGSD